MTRSYDSDYWHDLLSGYVLGDLTPEELEALQQHLSDHPDLAQELTAYQEALALLPYELPPVEPPAQLKNSLLNAIQPLPRSGPSHSPGSPPSSRLGSNRWLWMVGGMAAATIVTLGFENYRLQRQIGETAVLQQQLQETQAELERLHNEFQGMTTVVASLQQPEVLVYPLEGTGPAEGSFGSLVAIPGQAQMVLISKNLPLLSENQVYRLWAVADAASQPRYCGQFRNNSQGTVGWAAPEVACSNDPEQVLITIDAPDDPITSAGPLVMQSKA